MNCKTLSALSGPVVDQPNCPRTPPGVGKRQGGPLASCARGRRHTRNSRIYTLRKVLLHARTFEAIRATPEKRLAMARMSGTLRAPGERPRPGKSIAKQSGGLGGWRRAVGWDGRESAQFNATLLPIVLPSLLIVFFKATCAGDACIGAAFLAIANGRGPRSRVAQMFFLS